MDSEVSVAVFSAVASVGGPDAESVGRSGAGSGKLTIEKSLWQGVRSAFVRASSNHITG